MVTIEEIEQRERELSETESQTNQILSQPLPQRKYGFGITRETQRQAYAKRDSARGVLIEIEQQRAELRDIRNQLAEQERQRREQDEANRQREEVEQAQRLIERGKGGLLKQGTPLQRDIYKRISQVPEPQYQERITQLPQEYVGQYKETITPLPQNVLGDTTYKETIYKIPAKVLGGKKSTPPPQITIQDIDLPERTIIINPQITEEIIIKEQVKYKSFIADIEKRFIDIPFEKYAKSQEKYIGTKYAGVYGSPKVTRIAKSLIEYPIYAPKQIETYARNKEARAEFKRLSKIEKAQEIADITGSGLVLGLTAFSSYKYLTKPVRLKNIKVGEDVNLADTKIADIKIGSRLRTISQFRVIGISAGEKTLEVPRYKAIQEGVITETQLRRIQQKPIEDILSQFPEAKFRQLRPIRLSESITQPFLVRGGRVQGEPAVFSFRLNQNVVERELRRITNKRLSILAGQSYEPRSIRTLSRQRLELTDIQRVALERIESIPSRTGLNIKRNFPKETELQTGSIALQDIYKVQFKGGKRTLKEIPYGRRTTRAETTAIQKEIAKIETSNKQGLKEIEYLTERIGVIDVTFPRLRKPRTALEIKGRVERREFEYPGEEPLGLFQTTGGQRKSSKLFYKQLYDSNENQKAIQKAIGSVSLKQLKLPKSLSKISEPNLRTESIYAGTGLYERTESLSSIKITSIERSLSIQRNVPTFRNIELTRTQTKFNLKEITKELSKYQQKEITKEVTKQLPKSISKEVLKEINKQQEKQLTKQITKQQEKQLTKSPPFRPPRIPPIKQGRPLPIIPGLRGKGKQNKLTLGYKPFVIKKGEKFYLRGILPKGQALRKAETEAKKSLRATFGVKATKIKIPGLNEKDYKPSSDLFRSYRIKAGKKIPLKDTFIQKLTKRLSFAGEKAEIQRSRKRR